MCSTAASGTGPVPDVLPKATVLEGDCSFADGAAAGSATTASLAFDVVGGGVLLSVFVAWFVIFDCSAEVNAVPSTGDVPAGAAEGVVASAVGVDGGLFVN